MMLSIANARFAGYTAVISSIGALLACLVYVPLLLLKINEINQQLTSDTEAFRLIADEAWTQLIDARTISSTTGGNKRRRAARQSGDDGYGNSAVVRGNSYSTGNSAAIHERPMQKVYPLPDYSDGKKDEFVEKSQCCKLALVSQQLFIIVHFQLVIRSMNVRLDFLVHQVCSFCFAILYIIL